MTVRIDNKNLTKAVEYLNNQDYATSNNVSWDVVSIPSQEGERIPTRDVVGICFPLNEADHTGDRGEEQAGLKVDETHEVGTILTALGQKFPMFDPALTKRETYKIEKISDTEAVAYITSSKGVDMLATRENYETHANDMKKKYGHEGSQRKEAGLDLSEVNDIGGIVSTACEQYNQLVIGESHSNNAARKFLIDAMPQMHESGVEILFLENISCDYQEDINAFLSSEHATLDAFFSATHPEHTALQNRLDAFAAQTTEEYNYTAIFEKAKENGIKPVAIDTPNALFKCSTIASSVDKDDRIATFLGNACDIIQAYGEQKSVVLVGMYHAVERESHEHQGTFMPGIADALNVPAIMVTDAFIANHIEVGAALEDADSPHAEKHQFTFDYGIEYDGTTLAISLTSQLRESVELDFSDEERDDLGFESEGRPSHNSDQFDFSSDDEVDDLGFESEGHPSRNSDQFDFSSDDEMDDFEFGVEEEGEIYSDVSLDNTLSEEQWAESKSATERHQFSNPKLEALANGRSSQERRHEASGDALEEGADKGQESRHKFSDPKLEALVNRQSSEKNTGMDR